MTVKKKKKKADLYSASMQFLNQKGKSSSETNYLFTEGLNNAPVGSKVVIT